jgi:hypothetical protein
VEDGGYFFLLLFVSLLLVQYEGVIRIAIPKWMEEGNGFVSSSSTLVEAIQNISAHGTFEFTLFTDRSDYLFEWLPARQTIRHHLRIKERMTLKSGRAGNKSI